MNGELRDEDVLWDVVEEHASEASFLVEQLARFFASAVLTREDLTRNVERRLLAHLDGLTVGGDAAFERVLAPALMDPEGVEAEPLVVAAWIAIARGSFGRLRPALSCASPAVHRAVGRAGALAGGAAFDAWLDETWASAPPAMRTALLALFTARRRAPGALFPYLQDEDLALVRAAARNALFADGRRHLAIVEHLLGHPDEEVRWAALAPALLWRSTRAMGALEPIALDVDRPRRDAMLHYAVFGGAAQHENLAGLLSNERATRDALFALGFSGDPSWIPTLLEHMADADPLVARTAAQAVASLTGLDLREDALSVARPVRDAGELPPVREDAEARDALPPLEDDTLDADIAPAAEEELPAPNVAAIRRAAASILSGLPRDMRVIGGAPLSPDAVSRFLSRAPLGLHPGAAWLGARESGILAATDRLSRAPRGAVGVSPRPPPARSPGRKG